MQGVDLSPKMLDRARAKPGQGGYDELVLGGVDALRSLAPGQIALVTAADVLVYMASLAPFFSACAEALGQVAGGGGLVAATVEALERSTDLNPGERGADGAARGWALLQSGRYAHSEAHVRELAAEHGFRVARFEAAATRIEGSDPVHGWIFVLRHVRGRLKSGDL